MTGPVDVSDALERLIALHEIGRVIGRYCMLFDDQDWDGLAELWTHDAKFVVSDAAGDVAFEGRPAVLEFLRTCLPDGYASKHLIAPPVIDLGADGTSATARTDVVWFAANFDPTIVARYDDELSRVDDRWLIRRRVEHPMPYAPGPPPMSGTATGASAATMRR